MKNKFATIMLISLFFLNFTTAFADGDMGSGGKTCPNQSNCLVQNSDDSTDTGKDESILSYSIFAKVKNYILNLI